MSSVERLYLCKTSVGHYSYIVRDCQCVRSGYRKDVKPRDQEAAGFYVQRIATPGDLTAQHNLRQRANELLVGVLVKPLFEKSLQTMLA